MLFRSRSEEHTSELQSPCNLVCRLLLEKKKRGQVVLVGDVAGPDRGLARRLLALLDRDVAHQPVRGRPFFFFNDRATPEIYTLSLHDALPISDRARATAPPRPPMPCAACLRASRPPPDRKSKRLNSSHLVISYAVFCLKK